MELGSAVEAYYAIYQMDAGAGKSDRGVVLVVRPDRGGSDIKGGNRRTSERSGAGEINTEIEQESHNSTCASSK